MNQQYMLQALEASRQALPGCQPNPPVGCVLVRNDKVVSVGYTQKVGGNHAEVEALNGYDSETDGEMEGVTAYVTLEPCSFVGRTPACAKTLVTCGIKKVVVAMLDPDPRNAGRGIDTLKEGGVEVEIGLCGEEASAFLSPYLGKS